jgi:hypothetical protein
MEAVCHKRLGLLSEGVMMLHDNARPHIALTAMNLLNTWHWGFFPNLPIILIGSIDPPPVPQIEEAPSMSTLPN